MDPLERNHATKRPAKRDGQLMLGPGGPHQRQRLPEPNRSQCVSHSGRMLLGGIKTYAPNRKAKTSMNDKITEAHRNRDPPDPPFSRGPHARSPARTSDAQTPPRSHRTRPSPPMGRLLARHGTLEPPGSRRLLATAPARLPKRHALAQGPQNPRRPTLVRVPAASGNSTAPGSSAAPWPNCSTTTSGSSPKDTLYRCHDRLLVDREALFTHIRDRWSGLFNVRYDILLYDLTST